MNGTYKYQNDLPQLPIPELAETIDLYLRCLKPLVDDAEYEKTKTLAADFMKEDGPKLQNKLCEYADSIYPESWLMPYSRDIYLTMRKPITIEGNYILELADLPNSEALDYLSFISVLVRSIGIVFLKLADETLPPLLAKETPQCMNQFKGSLRSTKIPKKDKDEFVLYKYIKEVHSFGVFYRNRFHTVRLIDENGKLASVKAILSALTKIYNDKEEKLSVSFSTVAFAGSDRAAELIEAMCANDRNRQAMELVNKTMFNITLVDCSSSEHSISKKLYTDTTDIWPYKPWSITVYNDKICCFNNEHTYFDALTNIYLLEHIIDIMRNIPPDFKDSSEVAETTLVNFDLDGIKDELIAIKSNYLSETDRFSSISFKREGIPVMALKNNKVNIDFYFQQAFIYAQLKAFGEPKVTHESVSVTQYYDGRTSAVRSVSEESLAFVKAFEAERWEQLPGLLLEASTEHVSRVKAAKRFCCFLRHAAGLNIMYERFGEDLGIIKKPGILSDENYIKFSTQQLSTSSVGNLWFVNTFAYAPQTEKGLGIGYITHGDVFITDISFYKSENDTADKFVNALNEYFDKMESMMNKIAQSQQ